MVTPASVQVAGAFTADVTAASSAAWWLPSFLQVNVAVAVLPSSDQLQAGSP